MFVVTVARAELIHGIVYDIDTNKPIENVNIFLPDMDIGTLTAKNGSFKFNSIDSDTCLVHASMIGYKLFSENFNRAFLTNARPVHERSSSFCSEQNVCIQPWDNRMYTINKS